MLLLCSLWLLFCCGPHADFATLKALHCLPERHTGNIVGILNRTAAEGTGQAAAAAWPWGQTGLSCSGSRFPHLEEWL